MSTIAEKCAQIDGKVQRAHRHIAEAEQVIHAFLGGKPFGIASARQPEDGRLFYFVSRVQPSPPEVALIAGDGIQNLVSALDHIAYQLVCSDTRRDAPPNARRIYFPIGQDVRDYNDRRNVRMQGASAITLAAIDGLQPYGGGTGECLWQLSQLNNIDKHRLLLTVGSGFRSVNVNLGLADLLARTRPDFPPEMIDMVRRMPGAFFKPADKGFPLTVGYRLFVGMPGDQPNPETDAQMFRFDIALSEPGILEAHSLLVLRHVN